MQRLIARTIAPLKRAIGNLAARGVVVLANSANKMQTLQIKLLHDEIKQDIEHFEPYGFTSKPKSGAEVAAIFFDGDRSHGIALIVADRRYRLTGLADGEMAIHDDQNQKVHLTRTGIKINTPLDIELRGENVRIHGNASLIIECNGHGEKWFPDRKNTYTDNAVAGSHNNINAPNIP